MPADRFLTAVISRVRKGGAVSPQRLRAKKQTSDFEKVRGTQGRTHACSRMLPHRFGERKPGPTGSAAGPGRQELRLKVAR